MTQQVLSDTPEKTWAMQLVEAREGRPLEELIEELYTRDGLTQAAIAERLGITGSALSRWMVTLGIPSRRRKAS